jgi:tetratricopeptide (TPR) repeat protein
MAGTDQLSAHLDRGWDLLNRKDLDSAVRSAQRAIELAPEDPEGYYLLGSIEARAGRAEDALRHFKEAFDLDDGYVDAFLAAAEIRLGLGQPDACIELCDEVLSFVEDPRDITDATLLKFDAQIHSDDRAGAAAALEALPAEDLDDASMHQRMGIAFWELGNVPSAARHFARAAALDPALADAHYFLGLCCSEQGDALGAIAHWLRTRALDAEEAERNRTVTVEELRVIARRAIDALPRELRARIGEATLEIATLPAAELVAEGTDPRIACWFAAASEPEPAPAPKKKAARAAPRLTAVFIYQANLLRGVGPEVDIEEDLRATIAHEASHFFGISEEEMKRLGLADLHRHD